VDDMSYNVKYNNIQSASDDFTAIQNSLESYTQRLTKVNSSLGSFPQFQNIRNTISSGISKVRTLTESTQKTVNCLDNVIISYIKAENDSYNSVCVGVSPNAIGAVKAGITGIVGISSWASQLKEDSKWLRGVVSGGAKSIHHLAKESSLPDGLLNKFDSKIVGNFKAAGTALSVITTGTQVFNAGRNSYLEGNSKGKVIGDSTGEAVYQVAKTVIKGKVCGAAATKGAAVGAAIGSVVPGVGTVVGAVVGGAIGYFASSWAVDKGMEYLDNKVDIKGKVSKAVATTIDSPTNTS